MSIAVGSCKSNITQSDLVKSHEFFSAKSVSMSRYSRFITRIKDKGEITGFLILIFSLSLSLSLFFSRSLLSHFICLSEFIE